MDEQPIQHIPQRCCRRERRFSADNVEEMEVQVGAALDAAATDLNPDLTWRAATMAIRSDDENPSLDEVEGYSPSQSGDVKIITNHTGYTHSNSSSWEHDDTGDTNNYSGCVDDMVNAEAEHEGWEEGYDY